MIERIIKIKNVGKYEDCDSSPEFEDVNLIFAENANGKTTLSEIFHSLGNNRPEDEVAQRRKDLLAYCELDTLAMVKIYQHLQNEVLI